MVCALHCNLECSEILLTRYTHRGPILCRFPANRHISRENGKSENVLENLLNDWKEIMVENKIMTSAATNSTAVEVSDWWTQRKSLDNRIQRFLKSLEKNVFGGLKGLLTMKSNEFDLGHKCNHMKKDIAKLISSVVSKASKRNADIENTLPMDVSAYGNLQTLTNT